MELGSNFTAKLEPFLLMGKSAKGAAAAKLVQDATAAPGVFVFSELMDLPNVQELAKSEQHAKAYSLLQLFSYKTFQDYSKNKDEYPALNDAQIVKLKHLTIVTLASERRILPYSDLMEILEMKNVRDLEDLIIDAIYLDILRGKLDQKESQLEVEYTMGRDVEPGKLESILAALTDWAATTQAVLATLDSKISSLSAAATMSKTVQEENEKSFASLLKEAQDKYKEKTGHAMGSGSGGGRRLGGDGGGRRLGAVSSADQAMEGPRAGGGSNAMDVDEPEGSRSKSRKSTQDVKAPRKRNRG